MDLKKELISAGINILFSSVGLVAGNVYDILTNRLTLTRGQTGDPVDEELRQIFVRGLNNVKSKLDCISLKELDASRSFLEEGIELLNLALDNLNEDQTANESNAADEVATRVQSDTASTKDRFASAKECFQESRKAATIAFHNKSMSTKHRIVACILRVAARILETGYEDPKAATRTCLVALKDLHRLPAIEEMFAVFLEGKLKSMLKKDERLEHIISVLFINHTLFNFASKDSSNAPTLITWPGIQLRNNRAFYPILNAHNILEKISRVYKLVKQLNQIDPVWRIFTSERCYAVNKRGEIILLKKDRITVIYSTRESKDFMFPDTAQSRLIESKRNSLAVDCSGKVYALRWLTTEDEDGNVKGNFVLNVFDEHYNMEHVSVLDFLNKEEYKNVNIAVDKKHSLIMIRDSDGQVFICNERGEKRFKFKQAEDWVLMNMSISDNNDVMIVSDDRSVVETYSLSEGKIKLSKPFSQGHNVMQVAFHKETCQITVFAYIHDQEGDRWFSYRYSEEGKPETGVRLFQLKDPEKYCWKENIKNLPSSAVAVVIGKNIIFI